MVHRETTNCYQDLPALRVLDLRPRGADAIPVLSVSRGLQVRAGTREHVHAGCLEVSYCARGTAPFVANGEDLPISAQQIFVSRPDQPHWMRTIPRGLILYRILFHLPAPNKTILGLSHAETHALVSRLLSLRERILSANAAVEPAFLRLFALYDSPPPNRAEARLRIRIAALELLFAILDSAARRRKPFRSQAIDDLVAKMQKQPEERYPLASLAADARMSHVAFLRAFKRVTGTTPHAFLIAARMEKARVLLAQTGLPVTVISDRLGFATPRHFATSFQRTVGATPTKYRRCLLGGGGVVGRN